MNFNSQQQGEASPVICRWIQEVVDIILADSDAFVPDHALEEILAGKGQVENNGKDGQRTGSLCFGNSGSVEHAADFKFGEDIGGNA